jgi:hypothetical protein
VLNFVQGDKDKNNIVQYKSLASILQNQLYLFGGYCSDERISYINKNHIQTTNKPLLYPVLSEMLHMYDRKLKLKFIGREKLRIPLAQG